MTHQFVLHPGRPIRAEFRRLGNALLEEGLGTLRETDDELNSSVAILCARLRDLRGLLRLVRFDIGEERYLAEEEKLRSVCRSVEPVRQSGALIAAAAELGQGPESLENLESGALVSRLEGRHLEHAFALAQSSALEEATAILRESVERLAELPIGGEGFPVLRPGLERVATRGSETMLRAQKEPTGKRLRSWGRQVGYLASQLSILSVAWPTVIQPFAEETERLYDMLKRDEDLERLSEILAHDRSLAPKELRDIVRTHLSTRRRASTPVIWDLGRRVYSEPPRHLAARMGRYWMSGE